MGHKVVVSGGGIGGLTLAKLLILEGIDVVVLERSPQFQQSGEVLIQPCGKRVLQAAGLLATASSPSCCFQYDAMQIRHEKGFVIMDRSNLAPKGKTCSHVETVSCTRRQGMVEELSAELPPGVVRLGTKLLSVSQTEDGVTLVCERNGIREEITCDFVIGADGKHSMVRRCLWEAIEDPPRTFAEFFCITWTLDLEGGTPLDAVYQQKILQMTWGVGALIGLMPISEHVCCVFICLHTSVLKRVGADVETLKEVAARGESRGPEVQRLLRWLMIEGAKAFRGEVRERFDFAVDHAPWHDKDKAPYLWCVEEKRPPVSLCKGRAALLGDAAHVVCPLTGMGANLALEDAMVLAGALASIDKGELPWQQALPLYSSLRLPRVKTIVEYSATKRMKATLWQLSWFSLRMWLNATVIPSLAKRGFTALARSLALLSNLIAPALPDPTDAMHFDATRVWPERDTTAARVGTPPPRQTQTSS